MMASCEPLVRFLILDSWLFAVPAWNPGIHVRWSSSWAEVPTKYIMSHHQLAQIWSSTSKSPKASRHGGASKL